MKFIYIGQHKNQTPKGGFKAIRLSKSDKQKLYPTWDDDKIKKTDIIYPQTECFIDGKVFVRGLGWKKFGKRNVVDVPLFSGNIDEWDDYLLTYGERYLFYSLSGYSLDDMDCCAYKEQTEFLSSLQCGVEKYQKYVDAILEIQEIQRKRMTDELSKYYFGNSLKNIVETRIIRPTFTIYSLVIPPYLDTVVDDDNLYLYYRDLRSNQLTHSHEKYDDMMDLKEKRDNIYVERGYKTKEYYVVDEKYCALKKLIDTNVKSQIMNEVEDGSLPICMKERIVKLFGERCAELYEYILNGFKDY